MLQPSAKGNMLARMQHQRLRASAFCVAMLLGCWPSRAAAKTFYTEVEGNPLGSEADWSNYVRLVDLDGDGDLDVIVPNCGGFFSSPQAQPIRIYRNNGGFSFSEDSQSMLGEVVSQAVRVVAAGDIDGDGDVDLFFPSAAGAPDMLYVNAGEGSFSNEASTRLPAGGSSSHSAAARFADLDGDGDLDLLVGSGYAFADTPAVQLYLNDGTGIFEEASGRLPSSLPQGAIDPDDIDVFDADGDYDLDVLVNAHKGANALWLNDGSGTFSDASGQLAAPGAGSQYHYSPGVCDVDGDKDLDIWVDNTGGGYTEQLLLNDGSGNFSDVTAQQVSGNPGGDDNQVACVDVDQDGDYDAVIAGLFGNKERVLLNDGKGNFALEPGAFAPGDNDPTLWMEFGDLDGDGALDVVTVQGEGSPSRNRVYRGDSLAKDTRVPQIPLLSGDLASDAAGGPVIRFAVRDAVVSDSGPRLSKAEVEVEVGQELSSVSARFVGGDLFQATLPKQAAGALLRYRACATDRQGNRGCSEQKELSFGGSTSSSGAGGSDSVAAASSTAASGGSSPGESSQSGGCSVERSAAAGKAWWLLLLLCCSGLLRNFTRRVRSSTEG